MPRGLRAVAVPFPSTGHRAEHVGESAAPRVPFPEACVRRAGDARGTGTVVPAPTAAAPRIPDDARGTGAALPSRRHPSTPAPRPRSHGCFACACAPAGRRTNPGVNQAAGSLLVIHYSGYNAPPHRSLFCLATSARDALPPPSPPPAASTATAVRAVATAARGSASPIGGTGVLVEERGLKSWAREGHWRPGTKRSRWPVQSVAREGEQSREAAGHR